MKKALTVAFQAATTMIEKSWGREKKLTDLWDALGIVHTTVVTSIQGDIE